MGYVSLQEGNRKYIDSFMVGFSSQSFVSLKRGSKW